MPYWKITTAGDLTEYLSGNAADRLAAYEDTGLEPEEIKDFMSRWKDAVELAGLCKEAGSDRLRELAEADRDGRLTNLVQDAQKQWKSEYTMRRKFEADRDRLQAELDAAVDDLKIASDCATCDMRGEKGFSACAPLFVGDEQSCKNYKWRGKENGDGKENS